MQLMSLKVREIVSGILGRVLRAGTVSAVRHKGTADGMVPAQVSTKLSRLVPRDYLRVDPEAIVHLGWSSEGGLVE